MSILMLQFIRSLLAPRTIIDFDPQANVIEVPVVLAHGSRTFQTNFVLDTGASFTVITPAIVTHLDLKTSTRSVEVITAGGAEIATTVKVPLLSVGRISQKDAPCLVTNLPDEAGVTGLLGLSFLRHFNLQLDFDKGKLKLKRNNS